MLENVQKIYIYIYHIASLPVHLLDWLRSSLLFGHGYFIVLACPWRYLHCLVGYRCLYSPAGPQAGEMQCCGADFPSSASTPAPFKKIKNEASDNLIFFLAVS